LCPEIVDLALQVIDLNVEVRLLSNGNSYHTFFDCQHNRFLASSKAGRPRKGSQVRRSRLKWSLDDSRLEIHRFEEFSCFLFLHSLKNS